MGGVVDHSQIDVIVISVATYFLGVTLPADEERLLWSRKNMSSFLHSPSLTNENITLRTGRAEMFFVTMSIFRELRLIIFLVNSLVNTLPLAGMVRSTRLDITNFHSGNYSLVFIYLSNRVAYC